MKYLLLFLFIGFLSAPAAMGQLNLNAGEPGAETVIEFEQTVIDLGEIEYGDTAKFIFRFKNAGEADLLIDNVKPSCTCTSLIYPEKAIAPGETGEIIANIDTEDKEGPQSKWLMVFYNGNPPVERLTLHFSVKPGGAKPLEDPAPQH